MIVFPNLKQCSLFRYLLKYPQGGRISAGLSNCVHDLFPIHNSSNFALFTDVADITLIHTPKCILYSIDCIEYFDLSNRPAFSLLHTFV